MAAEYKYVPIVYRNTKANGVKNGHGDNFELNKNRNRMHINHLAEKYVVSDGGTISIGSNKLKTEEKTASKAKIKSLFSTILVIMVVFVMLAIVLAGNVKISRMNIENSNISSEIKELENEIKDIKLDITLATDLENIQTRAAELGMSCPDSSRVVYLDHVG